jgi:FXSXX-COOH protein
VPTPGYGVSGEADEGRERDGGLLSLSGLSLEDLAELDDSVIANALRDLVERRRYGTGAGEPFSNFNSAI